MLVFYRWLAVFFVFISVFDGADATTLGAGRVATLLACIGVGVLLSLTTLSSIITLSLDTLNLID